jgi:chemotaxis protein histidine kinase CheA
MPMSPDDVAKFKNLFVESANACLITMQDKVSFLLQTPQADATVTDPIIKELHLAAHSLGGESAVIGYRNIAELSSIIEKIIQAKIEGRSELTPDVLQKINEGIVKMLASVEEIEKNDTEIDLSEEINSLTS